MSDYIKNQINKAEQGHDWTYKMTLQIRGTLDKTNWMDITASQLNQIEAILSSPSPVKFYTEEEVQSLQETTADIAQIAGAAGYCTGDSRSDVEKYTIWAREFEHQYRAVEWGIDLDYIETIDKFTAEKLKA